MAAVADYKKSLQILDKRKAEGDVTQRGYEVVTRVLKQELSLAEKRQENKDKNN